MELVKHFLKLVLLLTPSKFFANQVLQRWAFQFNVKYECVPSGLLYLICSPVFLESCPVFHTT